MSSQSNARTIAAIQKMIADMQHLVDHPRMQQRNWVAKGREWLPILLQAVEDLADLGHKAIPANMSHLSDEGDALLIKVNIGHGNNYLRVVLNDVKGVTVYRGGEPGHRYVREAYSGFELKNGNKYLTNADEAQRIVDALRNAIP